MSTGVAHTDVSAYALGALDSSDLQAFTEHLGGCARCRVELAELSPVVSALRRARPIVISSDAPGPPLPDLVRHRIQARSRRGRGATLLAAAACVLLLGGGFALGVASNDHADTTRNALGAGIAPGAVTRSGTDAGTGVSGTLDLLPKTWGTSVALSLRNVRGPVTCELVAITRSGERRMVAGWAVPDAAPSSVTLDGALADQIRELNRFDVLTSDGRTLLTIPL